MFNMQTFMGLVQANDVNDHFTLKRSSLKKLIDELNRVPVRIQYVIQEWALLRAQKATKADKYDAALTYLANNPPGNFPVEGFPKGAVPVEFSHRFLRSEPTEVDFYYGDRVTSDRRKITDAAPTFAPGNSTKVDIRVRKHAFRFECKWKSSDGNLGSLSKVYSREYVSFRTDPTDEPFNYINAHHHEDGSPPNYAFAQPRAPSNAMNFGNNDDVHSTKDPRFLVRRPIVPGKLILDQSYQYNASGVDDERHWIDLPNAQFEIIREVVAVKSRYYYRWTKKNAITNMATKILFSEDILIEDAPELLPKHYTSIP